MEIVSSLFAAQIIMTDRQLFRNKKTGRNIMLRGSNETSG
jgi:hypothetical protein